MKKLGLISVISLLLAACGGSDSDSGTKFEDVEQNVALSANGGSIDSASYDETGAALVIDGDTSTQYWAGNVDGDSFVIDFGKTVGLTELKVFTNVTGFSTSNPPTVVELSTDKSSWETTAVPNFGGSSDISCSTYSSGSGSITCGYNSEVNARYLRVTTNNSASDSSDVNIYEVEATATVSVPVE